MEEELLEILKENLRIKATAKSVPYSDAIEVTISLNFGKNLINNTTVYL